MISTQRNQIKNAYAGMIISEAKINPVQAINKWLATNKNDFKDGKKIEKEVKTIIKLLNSDEDNILIMDNITQSFLVISKQIDDEKILEELSKILETI